MARKNIAAGNWKMNKNLQEGTALANAIAKVEVPSGVEVVLGVPFTHLTTVKNAVKDNAGVKVAAQNCHQKASGAFTGEISVEMLASVGVDYVILGHSERREYFNESDALLAEKLDAILASSMDCIFCCGEPLSIREAGTHVEYVGEQLKNGLFHISAAQMSKVVIAYEPIWAIGTGVTASPEQAQEMQAALRNLLKEQYGTEVANNTSILYGGSVKPANAKEIFGKEDVDGGLVGGASLDATNFEAIIKSF